ncbi:hypothetical protein M8818_000217 [Zalaria obscura]|uniref:Uncharacterized protein n=1 Tax=Zalaria obscura TaxID=2024903 RepID=A0ACC3SPG7_9PEZI
MAPMWRTVTARPRIERYYTEFPRTYPDAPTNVLFISFMKALCRDLRNGVPRTERTLPSSELLEGLMRAMCERCDWESWMGETVLHQILMEEIPDMYEEEVEDIEVEDFKVWGINPYEGGPTVGDRIPGYLVLEFKPRPDDDEAIVNGMNQESYMPLGTKREMKHCIDDMQELLVAASVAILDRMLLELLCDELVRMHITWPNEKLRWLIHEFDSGVGLRFLYDVVVNALGAEWFDLPFDAQGELPSIPPLSAGELAVRPEILEFFEARGFTVVPTHAVNGVVNGVVHSDEDSDLEEHH